jgi:thymidylate kinase
MDGGKRYGVVVVEGVNGAGKSTVASYLVERLDAVYYHFPPKWTHFRDEMRFDEDMPTAPRLAYYLGGLLQLSELVRRASQTSHVVADRYLASSLAAVTCLGDLSEAEVCRLAEPFLMFVGRPDVTLLLTVEPGVAAARIAARTTETGTQTYLSKRMAASPTIARTFADVVERHAMLRGSVVTLDTSSLDRTTMCEQSWDLVANALFGASRI